VLFEALLVLVVLSIGSSILPKQGSDTSLVSVRFRAAPEQPEPERAEDVPETKAAAEQSSARPVPRPVPPATQPRPEPTPALIPLSPPEIAASDIAPAPAPSPPPSPAPSRGMMGPPDTGPAQRDSQRVSGSGPNGEPLYAASWYREPYEDELRGYLSTATGPGWGLIACRTAPDFRVEDCVAIDEQPNGSNIARAVLAAAWQFRVRPPRVGGQLRVGEWVRIRITYDMRMQ
jgi:periplasmic protein TonB